MGRSFEEMRAMTEVNNREIADLQECIRLQILTLSKFRPKFDQLTWKCNYDDCGANISETDSRTKCWLCLRDQKARVRVKSISELSSISKGHAGLKRSRGDCRMIHMTESEVIEGSSNVSLVVIGCVSRNLAMSFKESLTVYIGDIEKLIVKIV